jgi:hypothetical protein
LAGCAPSHPGVATAIVRLRKLHNVVDVNLTSSTKAGESSTGGACPVQWNGTVSFEPETAASGTERVPVRLGGGQ